MDCDVAIVGAGAAGIAAARRLHAAGRSVIVLEASARIGGRAWTQGLAGMPLDMGCGWLHSAERNPLTKLGEGLGFTIDKTASAWRQQWRDLGFSPAEQRAADAAWDALDRRFQDDLPLSDRAADALHPGGRWNAYCQAISGYMNGASLDLLSVTDFLAYDNAASETNWRVREGYGALVAAGLPAVDVRVSSPVQRIAFDGAGVRLETHRGHISAGAAIVTASTNVLASGAIRFDSAADDHLHAASRLPLGLADKLFLALDGDHGLEADTHLLGNPTRADTGSYYIMPFGRPVIEGFYGGPGAEVFEQGGVAAATDFAIGELTALLGSGFRKHLRPIAASAWCHTDWIQGSYSHALPGHASARDMLARPIAGRLFFAGEATHATDFSTVHGAWESGWRAADAILSG